MPTKNKAASRRGTARAARHAPSASYSFTMRVRLPSIPGMFALLAGIIGKAGGDMGAIDLVSADRKYKLRDVTVSAADDAHAQRIIAAVQRRAAIRSAQRLRPDLPAAPGRQNQRREPDVAENAR